MNKLIVENLTKIYPNGVKALDKINLEIDNGMFGLLGPNGAGKSTLMRTIATLQSATGGTVTFNGVDVAKNPQFVRQKMGYLPQEFGVYPKISAYRLLDHLAILKGISSRIDRKEQVLSLLQQTNLYDKRKKSVSTFSGGMRQRFGIAQALLGDPKLIIVDEPTAGLDPEERNRFHDLLSEIGEQVIVLLSTHIVEDVRDLCSNMAIIGSGQLVLQGRPEKLIDNLEGKVWQKVVRKEDIDAHKTAFSVISTRLLGGKHQIHVLSDTLPDTGFESINSTLEDVYFSTLLNHQPITV